MTPVAPTSTLSPDIADHLLGHLTAARWFGGKGRRSAVVGLTPLPWLTSTADYLDSPHGLAVRPEVLEVIYPQSDKGVDSGEDGPHEFYQLVVAYRHAPHPDLHHAEIGRWSDPELGAVVAYDAMQDPEASSVVLRTLLSERTLRGEDAQVGFHLSAAEGLSADLEPAVFTGQQSNTSVMFGEVAMLKVFRRLELGRNLDIEVHDALSRTSMADVARLFGWIDASWPRTDRGTGRTEILSADLAMVVEKLADATDGWGLALDALQRGESFAEPARALGRALAETHAALRTAFPTGTQPGADVASTMTGRLAVAATIAPALEPYGAGLDAVFAGLGEGDLDTQRVHGDFHLGQTLHTPTGWKIIDFEGEPAKTLAERSVPDSVWRDIAGMLRSFDYAAASVPGPGSRGWAEECRAGFLDGYAGGELAATEAATLRAYEADKAVYEVVYEVRNRPEWVAIPLAAVAGLVEAATEDQARSAELDQARSAELDQARSATERTGASNQVKE